MANARKEPGTFSGTTFADIIPVPDKGAAVLAARLCNFWTDSAVPLQTHRDWLDTHVQPLLRGMPAAWFDLIGYASQLGPAGHNHWLSAERCKKVREWISNYSDRVK